MSHSRTRHRRIETTPLHERLFTCSITYRLVIPVLDVFTFQSDQTTLNLSELEITEATKPHNFQFIKHTTPILGMDFFPQWTRFELLFSYPESGHKLGDSSRRWLITTRQQMAVSAYSRIITLNDTPKKSVEHALLSKPVAQGASVVP